MSKDAIWRAFAETGEPVYYLLYRAAAAQEKAEETRGMAAG